MNGLTPPMPDPGLDIWLDVGIGLPLGAVVAALYLLGLAAGIRIALRSTRPTLVLLGSAAVRIALVLTVLAATARLGASAVLGVAAGFWAVRTIALAWLRSGTVPAVTSERARCD